MRDRGCGYDFEIQNNSIIYQIEVKGLDGDSGGVVFTSKEWDVAQKKKNTYYLAIVRNVSAQPEIQFIQNPANILDARKSIFTTVQVRWNVADNELLKHK